MVITNRKTITYATKETGFYIDVTEGKECIEGWIYHENIGIKMLMFGIPGRMDDEARLHEMVILLLGNTRDYIKMYREDYMDEEGGKNV